MKPPHLGTILPNPRTLKRCDAIADANKRNRRAIGDALFPTWERRNIGGEWQWHTENTYAVIGADNKPRIFSRREDGHWYASRF